MEDIFNMQVQFPVYMDGLLYRNYIPMKEESISICSKLYSNKKEEKRLIHQQFTFQEKQKVNAHLQKK